MKDKEANTGLMAENQTVALKQVQLHCKALLRNLQQALVQGIKKENDWLKNVANKWQRILVKW